MKNIKHKYSTAFIVMIISFCFVQAVKACLPPPPTAVLSVFPDNANQCYVIAGRPVLFDGSASLSNGGSLIRYEWDFNNDNKYDYAEDSIVHPDGTFDRKTVHTFTSPDTFIVRLRVTNGPVYSGYPGVSDTETVTVNVSDDVDDDNLPDQWETAYYGDTSFDGSHHGDGDGKNDMCEYLHGTNPNDTGSAPSAGIIVVNGVIQTAIDNSLSGDTIIVLPDTYVENVIFSVPNRTLRGLDPDNWEIVGRTIIQAAISNPTVSIALPADAGTKLEGLTITRGGEGVYCDHSTSPVINKCIIKGNKGFSGITLNNSSAIVENCFIIYNCSNNGGLSSYYGGWPQVTNCVFYGNMACMGGGLYNEGSSLTLRNCTIANNFAFNTGGGLWIDGHTDIYNTILWGNNGSQISGNGTVTMSHCNMDNPEDTPDDPYFVNIDLPTGKSDIYGSRDDGLRLRTNSPCINAGLGADAPTQDITGQARVGNVDIGAYELNRIRYVTTTGSGDGTTWANASSLQYALSSATPGEEIWVSAGTYTPGTTRYASFQLPLNVAVYGRFAVGDTAFTDRNPANQTILSGDIANPPNDGPNFTNRTDNSFHVVKGATGAVLDGFIIRGGYANDNAGSPDSTGGGIYGPVVARNCFITDNYAYIYGGGIYCESGSMQVANCVLTGNKVTGRGGAIHLRYMSNNLAEIVNCTITGNSANTKGGGIVGEYNILPIIENSIIYNNSASLSPNLWYYSLPPIISHSDIQGCGGSPDTGGTWVPALGNDCGGNIDSLPVFVNVSNLAGTDGKLCTPDDGLQLDDGSLCIDAGKNAVVFKAQEDITGVKRILDGVVDMGAYEFMNNCSGVFILNVEYDQIDIYDPVNHGWQNESLDCDPMTFSVSFLVEDSAYDECEWGTNSLVQSGSCHIILYLPEEKDFAFSLEGNTERTNSGFDYGSIYHATETDLCPYNFGHSVCSNSSINPIISVSGTAEGAGCGSEEYPAMMVHNAEDTITFGAGTHHIWFIADTVDSYYHHDAYFNFSITVSEP